MQGFTLYELLITVVVAGIVIGFGIPNLQQFQLNNRMVASTNDLLGAFAVARTEAIKRKTNVSICSTSDWTAAEPLCGARDPAVVLWHEGWVVFSDEDGDLTIDAGDDVVLRKSGPPSGNQATNPDAINNIKIVTNDNAEYFSFRATGFGRGDLFGAETLAAAYIYDRRGNTGDDGSVSTARALIVSQAGRAQLYRLNPTVAEICANAELNLVCP